MADLSPAAQAVRDAALATYDKSIPKDDNLWALDRASVAAALRAAADQVVPVHPMVVPGGRSYEAAWSATVQDKIRAELLAIADELEVRNDHRLESPVR